MAASPSEALSEGARAALRKALQALVLERLARLRGYWVGRPTTLSRSRRMPRSQRS